MSLKKLFVGFLAITLAGCTPPVDNPQNDTSNTPVIEIDWEDCGGVVGDHPCDFTFNDQDDTPWRLYDNIGKVILLDFSAEWCGWCQVSAAEIQRIQDYFDPTMEEFVWVTLIVEDSSGAAPGLEVIKEWVDSFGIQSPPVLQADRSIIDATGEDGYPVTSWPMFIIVNEDMIIENGLRGWSEEIITQMIADTLTN